MRYKNDTSATSCKVIKFYALTDLRKIRNFG